MVAVSVDTYNILKTRIFVLNSNHKVLKMELLNETDFEILEVLADGKRNNAANVAVEIDANRSYLNTRFSYLLNEDLVERIGPHEQSGLYEITPKGQVVVKHREAYLNDEITEFDSFIESHLDEVA